MIKCITFDFDGTLVVSNEIKHRSFFEVTEHISGAKQVLDTVLSDPNFGDRYAVFRYLAKTLDGGENNTNIDADNLAELYTSICAAKIINAPEVAGASYALDILSSSRFALVVSSATPQKTLKQIVTARGLSSLFDEILGAPASKEEHLRFIMKKYKYKSAQIVYVGDSEVDQRTAENIGCYFVGVGSDYRRFDNKPYRFVSDLKNLPKIVMGIG